MTFSQRVEGKLAFADSSSLNLQRLNRNNNMFALFEAISELKRSLMPTKSAGHDWFSTILNKKISFRRVLKHEQIHIFPQYFQMQLFNRSDTYNWSIGNENSFQMLTQFQLRGEHWLHVWSLGFRWENNKISIRVKTHTHKNDIIFLCTIPFFFSSKNNRYLCSFLNL